MYALFNYNQPFLVLLSVAYSMTMNHDSFIKQRFLLLLRRLLALLKAVKVQAFRQ